MSINLSGYSGQITFAQISEPRKKRKTDAESDSETPRCEIFRSPDKLSIVRKQYESRNDSPPPAAPASAPVPRSEELDAVFSEILKSPGASVSLKYSACNEKGVFSFLGKNAVRNGAVEVSCSGYDPTKKRPDDLVRDSFSCRHDCNLKWTSNAGPWTERWTRSPRNSRRCRRTHLFRIYAGRRP